MKNEGLDKLKDEAVNALVRWGKIGLGLYSMCDVTNTYMKVCGADKIPSGGISGIKEKRRIIPNGLLTHHITPLSGEQLYKVEMRLNQVSNSITTYVKSRFKR